MSVPLRVGLVAGEASGDTLGADLIHALRRLAPDTEFFGVAGPKMQAAGCETWEPAESLAVMGLFEIVLDLPRLAINATAVRVPVFFGHSLAVHASFERSLSVADATAVLQRGTGLSVIGTDSTMEFPTPATLAVAPDKVYVGRLRPDLTRDRALNFWVVADNVRKCAAHNAVSVAHILVNRCGEI